MMDGRRLVLEGRYWLECVGLAHLLDDPYTREEVMVLVERYYPIGKHGSRGVVAFEYDQGESVALGAREKRYREKQLAATRRDRAEIRRIAREQEIAAAPRAPEPVPDLIGDYRARRRARIRRIAPGTTDPIAEHANHSPHRR